MYRDHGKARYARHVQPARDRACLRRMSCRPEELARVRGLHPDVRLWTAAIDDRLDERGFIVPGLGDAGFSRAGVAPQRGNCLAEDAVSCEPVSAPNSLLYP